MRPSPSPARGRVAARLALALAGALLGLGAAELVARAVYVAPWHERLVGEQRASQELEYERNAYNLRGPAYQEPKPAHTARVLALGDSFTFGMGVPRDEDVFLRICERELNAELAPNSSVQILNAAIIGSFASQWGDVWDGLAPRFQPDVLLIVFFLRDGTLAGSVPEFFDRIRDEVVERNRRSPLYARSTLYRLWRDARDRELIRSRYTRLFRQAYFGGEEDTEEWRKARAVLRRVADSAREHGCAVGFVVFPVLAGLDEEPYPFQDVCDLLEAFARESGMEVASLLPAFRGLDGPDLWVSPFDQHPNEAAHAIAARALEPFLRRLIEESGAR